MNENIQNVKGYVKELFTGASKIVSFCKVHDCSVCKSSTRLYKRVLQYHNTDIVQHECTEYANNIQNLKKTS
ncbi:hypothetical protein N9X61_05210 [Sulfurimonas sp.]|nr:hypothetical protein [Sulfurimonas sp.]